MGRILKMKCKICGQFYFQETDFFQLFQFQDTCSKCQGLLDVPPLISSIPTDAGFIDLIILYPDCQIPYPHPYGLCEKYVIPLKQAITSDFGYDIILFLDAPELEQIHQWFMLMKAFKKQLYLSFSDPMIERIVMDF